ncbi:MAG: transporter permease [Cypionkella sp.]|uniref:ABC transporter permease n=1 Tax=Cypionkella sp. TaxID=2811411 RepID=UPI0026126522|nr:ABC transporter permease [Cypionkella sp.]MDB5658189.1 transporter permease [Cypionkella sp.]
MTAQPHRRPRQVSRFALAKGFVTVVISTIVLIGLCLTFAPSSVAAGALAGSLPFAAILMIVGLGQMLVVQQGGFDLSVAGGVSLSVVLATHYPSGDDAQLLPAVLIAYTCAVAAGVVNGLLVGFVRLNAIVATIGMNALIYGVVFAVSGGVPRITTDLLAQVAGGESFGVGNAVWFAIAILAVTVFAMKKTIWGRRFEAIGANPLAAAAIGLNVRRHQMMAYVLAQLFYCSAGLLIAGITTQPTAFQGDSLLLPSVAVVVLGGTSLLGGRGFPISTAIAALFLNQLSQFAFAVGVPYSAQTIIQALALGLGIGIYSIHMPSFFGKINKLSNREEEDDAILS